MAKFEYPKHNVGGIVGIDEAYWSDRLRDTGMPALVVRMTIQAIADALMEPILIIDSTLPKWKRRKMRDSRRDRTSAWRWIFSEEEEEFTFRDVCQMIGVDPKHARCQILFMYLEGQDIPGFTGVSRPKRRVLDCPDMDFG